MLNSGIRMVISRIIPVLIVRGAVVFVGMAVSAVGLKGLINSIAQASGVEVHAGNVQEILQTLPPDQMLGAILNPVLWIAIILNVALFLWAQAGIMAALYPNPESKGGQPTRELKEVLVGGLKLMWPMFVIDVFYTLAVALGMVLLIIPGIWLAIRFAFAPWLIIVEEQAPYAAMRRSAELVKGFWWAVFGRLFLVGVIGFAVSFVLGMIPILGSIVAGLLIPPFLNACQLNVLESLRESRQL